MVAHVHRPVSRQPRLLASRLNPSVAVGTGSGLSLVTIPLLLNEISSKRYKASFGILHQVSIGIGMIVAQSLSIPFAQPWMWRWVLVIGFAIAAVLFVGSGAVTLAFPTKVERHSEGDEEERPLVDRRHSEEAVEAIGVKDLIHAEPAVKRGGESAKPNPDVSNSSARGHRVPVRSTDLRHISR